MKRYLTVLLLTGGFLHFRTLNADSSTSRRSHIAKRRSNRRGNQTRLVGNRAIAAPPSATKLGECGSNTPGHVPVFFVHLHKSGGTTFMKLASVNGWCTPKASRNDAGSFFGKNGNPSTKDAPRGIWSSGTAMGKYALSNNIDVWATEWFVPTELVRRKPAVCLSVCLSLLSL